MPISIYSGIVDESWLIAYDNREVRVEASKQRFFHALFASDRNGFGRIQPFDIFFRVLNELVWFLDIKVDDLNGGHGEYAANLNFRASDDSYLIKLGEFRQQVTTEEQHLALGFFREALSGGSTFYQFICYAKILEIPFKDGKAKGGWVDQAISGLQDDLVDCKIDILGGKSLGKWLHEDCRHALAHAKVKSGRNCQGSE